MCQKNKFQIGVQESPRSTKIMLLALALIGLTACMKKPDHTPNYGPESTVSEINSSLSNLESPDVYSIRVGNFTYIEETLSISTDGPEVTNQEGVTITAKTDSSEDPSVYFLDGVHQFVRLTEAGYSSSKKAFTIGFRKPQTNPATFSAPNVLMQQVLSQSLAPTNNPLAALTKQVIPFSLQASVRTNAEKQKITFHNFKESTVQIPVPLLVRNRPNCGGLADCNFIQAKKLEFDQVRWTSDTQGDRTRYRYLISNEVPPILSFDESTGDLSLTNELLSCAQLWMNYQGQTVPVTQCRELKDFNLGSQAL